MHREKQGVHSIERFNVVISVIMIAAIILGVYGQSIAYYISDNLVGISPVYFLTALTVISVILFLIAAILTSRHMKTQSQNESKVIKLIIIIGFVIGTLVSVFSTVATIMWWG